MTTMMTMRCALVALFLTVPVAAAAQQPSPPADPEKVAASEAEPAAPASRSVAAWFDAGREASAAQATARRILSPSMVGYVNDGSVRSQVRLRFDAGNGINSPDRAELFYAKCGCYRDLPGDHPAFDPDAPGPGPGIATDLRFQQLYLYGEYALTDRVSLLGELPIRWLQPQAFLPETGDFQSGGGLSDFRAGAKIGMVSTETAALTLQLVAQFPTSNAGRGLGVDHFSFEPAVLYNQAFNDSVRLEGQLGVILPSGGSDGIGTTADSFAGRVLYYGIGPSVEIYRNDQVSFVPVVELVGWRVLDGYQTSTFSAVDNLDVVNLKIGARIGFRDTSSIYVGYGRSLTDAWWYRNILRLEYRVGF
jgi:hypothetical protein